MWTKTDQIVQNDEDEDEDEDEDDDGALMEDDGALMEDEVEDEMALSGGEEDCNDGADEVVFDEELVEDRDEAIAQLPVSTDIMLRASLTQFFIFLPHFRLYGVVSLHMCVLPYKYRDILEMLRSCRSRRT